MEKMISDLPEDIVRVILRSARNAARFSVQSKQFRDMFNIIQHLEFVYSKTPFVGSFTDYVNGMLSALPEDSTRVRKFTLKSSEIGIDQVEINRWLCRILNYGVLEIEMGINGDVGYSLPLRIFNCKTIREMKLGSGFVIDFVPENASFPVLETLVLDSLRFDRAVGEGCAFQALLRACYVLKELVIDGTSWESWNWSGVLSSESLRRLTISRVLSDEFVGPDYLGITFDTPNVEYFEYCDFVADAYPVVNFDSLVKAELNLQLVADHYWNGNQVLDYDPITSNPTNLINGIRNVHILELWSPQTFDLLYFFSGALPVFQNLHHLTMVTDDSEICWRFLPLLLESAPNLKTLRINGCLHYDEETNGVCYCLFEYSCLLSCHLEVLEIYLWENGTAGELEQVKHFLGKLSHLLLLKVHIMGGLSDREMSRIISDLLVLPRASPICVIEHIHAPY